MPIDLGAIELFGIADTHNAIWIDVGFALIIGAVGILVARSHGMPSAQISGMALMGRARCPGGKVSSAEDERQERVEYGEREL